ncbi:class III extradiol ring-cleavage dioxygenase [Breoghania sp. L-A4]|uniref:DODA-type extradiol aromatic ring-opening family dioxygenase n=1 Tax=Breoghania sp. L-A4 TaxID=2304600 RepID=UPI000E35D431|nr:class III extradiol ring-cleavage dioxygenase [Breoghania sp. L-A4]AXS40313.1 dioxygenase [Breoghania sp. L-A4]
MSRLPPLFISHGSPMLLLQNTAARAFLGSYGAQLGKPDAIVIASAHFETERPSVVTDPAPGMIYDMHGFPKELYQVQYRAPGAPAVAQRVARLLGDAGLAPDLVAERGYDHGTWVPLSLLYPDADIPVVQIAVQPDMGPAHHLRMGEALSSLADENILVIGSGSLTHNLHELRAPDGGRRALADAEPAWVKEFADWVGDRIAAGDAEALADYRARAPHAVRNHPTDEHYLPVLVAIGAAKGNRAGACIHSSHEYGVLRMDAFAFQ